jgi:predicted RNA-binding Zn-ribbon protein involved in translation (DUF1610 family)
MSLWEAQVTFWICSIGNKMNDTTICENCESEFRVEELESEYELSYCPYCGEALGGDDE